MNERITPKQAARIIGVSVPFLNYQMDMNIWDLGMVGKSKSGRRTHVIFKSKLEKYLGREITDTEIGEK